jgi:hypothetical protein
MIAIFDEVIERIGQLVGQGALGLPQPFNLVGNIVPCRTAGPDKLRVKSAYKEDKIVIHGGPPRGRRATAAVSGRCGRIHGRSSSIR